MTTTKNPVYFFIVFPFIYGHIRRRLASATMYGCAHGILLIRDTLIRDDADHMLYVRRFLENGGGDGDDAIIKHNI